MTEIDRRKFLFQSGATIGGFLASPRLGFLAVAAGALAGTLVKEADSQSKSTEPGRQLLRSGEPINSQGQPLGYGIAELATVAVPTATPGTRLLAVVVHGVPRPNCEERIARRSVGISTLEFKRDANRWLHEVSSVHNRRWDLETPIAIEGARLVPDQAAYRVQEMQAGTDCASCLVATPWQTVLCGEEGGWIVEVNPLSGHAVKRFSLGKIGALKLEVVAKAGTPVTIYAMGASHYFKFVSHQRFDAQQIQANWSVLLIGELWAADFATQKWICLTEGVLGEKWAALMRDPLSAPTLPPAFSEVPEAALIAQMRGVEPAFHSASSPFIVKHDESGSTIHEC